MTNSTPSKALAVKLFQTFLKGLNTYLKIGCHYVCNNTLAKMFYRCCACGRSLPSTSVQDAEMSCSVFGKWISVLFLVICHLAYFTIRVLSAFMSQAIVIVVTVAFVQVSLSLLSTVLKSQILPNKIVCDYYNYRLYLFCWSNCVGVSE